MLNPVGIPGFRNTGTKMYGLNFYFELCSFCITNVRISAELECLCAFKWPDEFSI